jgi:two-component sensor histidine kinase
MLVLVVLTLLGSTAGGSTDLATLRSRAYLSNFLIGGSVGGTLTGLYASRNRRQRTALRRQTRRLKVLNRLLRHEVLNAVTVAKGYATGSGDDHPDAGAVVQDQLDAIQATIEEVKYLTRSADVNSRPGESIDLAACLEESVEAVRGRHPDARISVGEVPDGLTVRANERLDQVFTHLVENAVVYADEVDVSVTAAPDAVRVSVRDDGPGLPESQRALLETGEIEEFDDPGTGFGLNVVRLLVESYGGTIETDVGESGTTITVGLPPGTSEESNVGPTRSDLTRVRPATPHLVVVLGASLVAGIPYGIVTEAMGGSVAGIGVFYGLDNPIVGWFTHEFHSAVFAFVFAALASMVPGEYREDFLGTVLSHLAVGIGWALCLFVVAAGVIAPIWLRLLGIGAPIPNLDRVLLLSHLAWGASLGLLTPLGYRYAVPWLPRLGRKLDRGQGRDR